MRIFLHPLFLFASLTYFVLKLTRHSRFRVPIVHDYLADLLCMPVVLALALAAMRFVEGNPRRKLSLVEMVAAVVLFSGLFEGLFPLISDRFTSDPVDIILYAAGAALFAAFMNR